MRQLHWALVLILALGGGKAFGAWQKKIGPLLTTWGENLAADQVLQEYPRPQLERANWINLNGVWQCKEGAAGDVVPTGQDLDQSILVPFCVESSLSGIRQSWRRIWYRKMVAIPEAWAGQRIWLHFGAVDWESEVFVNGKSVGVHKGGYDPFSYDITAQLGQGAQEIIVRVFDPTDGDNSIAHGKQLLEAFDKPGFDGTRYSPVSGIWQTVWLEAVPQTSITDLKMVPDVDNSQVQLTVDSQDTNQNVTFEATAFAGDTPAGNVRGRVNTQQTISIPHPILWSNRDPFLYDLKITLFRDGTAVDSVKSYFGMRKISIGERNGVKVILLNNEFVFNYGPLDQGYWPDGLYTAPSDEALKSDIENMLNLGFNAVRKHIKVEPDRWYYWCDKLGLLVWQDMPCAYAKTSAEKAQFESELERMVRTHWNHPSIILWVMFNEGWGLYDEQRITSSVMALDPSRLVTSNSGGGRGGQINDLHWYSEPVMPGADSQRAKVLGEYGGLYQKIDNHVWFTNYYAHQARPVRSAEEFKRVYTEYVGSLCKFRDDYGLSGAIYTQLTDVEGEINGFYTYDRKILKEDINVLRPLNQATHTSGMAVPSAIPAGNIAYRKPVTASSVEKADLAPANATDGNVGTRWSSQPSDPQWLCVDLGTTNHISRVRIWWEAAYAKSYKIQTSNDATNWTDIYGTTTGGGDIEDIKELNQSGRYLRIFQTQRGTPYGYSIYEVEVFSGKESQPLSSP